MLRPAGRPVPWRVISGDAGATISGTRLTWAAVREVTMTISAGKPTITADEFERMPGTKGFELTDGVLVEKNTSYLSGVVEAAVLRLLGDHCARTGAGWVAGSEGGFRCFPEHPDRVWKPDASFVAAGRLS